jgi:hypothetical protein
MPAGMLVTAASANHFKVAIGLVGSAQIHMPASWRVVFYDLIGDLSAAMRVEIGSWCRTEYRRFNATRHDLALDMRVLTNSAWKPFIVLECLTELVAEAGFLIYADASIRFHAPMPPLGLTHALRRHSPVVGLQSNPEAIAYITHPEMVRQLSSLTGGPSDLKAYLDIPIVYGGLNFWHASPWTLKNVAEPWAACAAREACILPSGADGFNNRAGLSKVCRRGLEGHCHRGDMSALGILLCEAFHARDHVTSIRAGHWQPPYLRNTTMVGKDNWRKAQALIYGSPITIERFGSNKPAAITSADAKCAVYPAT